MTPDDRNHNPDETLDAFHRGAFHLVQPADRGHRAGIDAMLLAAAVPSGFDGLAADFGAGAGAAGLAVVARCPHARVLLVENAPEMAEYASRTLSHPLNTTISARAAVLIADVALAGRQRGAAGLADRSFDFTVMNPPFNQPRDRATPDLLKRQAHVMADGLFDDWIRTAAAVVRPRGGLAVIARPQSLVPLLNALAGRFGNTEILAIHPRADAAAIRIVLRATRAARGRLSLQPPLVLHDGPGNGFAARAEAICNGQASLFGD